MSLYRTAVTICDPRNTAQIAGPLDALVDTGSELSWFPEGLLAAAGIVRLRKRNFVTATGQHLTRDVGYAIVRAEQFETIDEVVFAQPGDLTLLGVRTLEGFGVMVDNLGHRLVATTTIAA
jgi:predicted aspartyl protease